MNIIEKSNVLSEYKVKIIQTTFLKEYDYKDCCVKNNLIIIFEVMNEDANNIHCVKCSNATHFLYLAGFTECSMTVYDVSSLGLESYRYKLLFMHDDEKFEILCDLIEPLSEPPETDECELSCEKIISDIKKIN